MIRRNNILRACLFTAALSFSAGFAGKAMASDPLPGDSIAPPVDVNIGLIYNQFNDAGTLGAVHGSNYNSDTHISDDITVLRYIRTFAVDGVEGGVQVYEPYIAFIGQQRLGIAPIGTPAPLVGAPGAGPLGAAHANLSSSSGFGQPNFSFFFWPINDPATGTYLVVSPWISPPISGFNKNAILNPGNDTWVYELEVGARTTLIGTPKTPNLQVEIWGEIYGFGSNHNSAANSPAVDVNDIPAGDAAYGVTNPVQASSSYNATFHEQTSEEFRVYFPYNFAPALGAFVAPGFYQSFGGKQTYTLHGGGPTVDSGNRTDESQLRLVAASFVNPTTQVMLVGGYDVANHGGPLNRTIELRLAKFF